MKSLFKFRWSLAMLAAMAMGCGSRSTPTVSQPSSPTAIHVHAGDDLQAALDRAATASIREVIVHEGIYAPSTHRQALVWFNRQHDGIHLRAEGQVVLTAANERIADPNHKSYPAVVNHVVYFGDGISNATKLSGFTITGANNYVTTKKGPEIEPASDEPRLAKTAFFYTDGGAIKVFGRSYPMLEDLEIVDNYSSPNGGGISIEHRGFIDQRVEIRNCIFRNNRSPLTGSAVTLLDHEFGSAALLDNCLFVQNRSNCSLDGRSQQLGSWNSESGHGTVTVFAFSQAEVRNCTFVGNRNGAEDLSQTSTIRDCIFWDNQAAGGWPPGSRYDLYVARPEAVEDCYLGSNSLRLDPGKNMLQAPDPEFDTRYVPQSSAYAGVGYRPANSTETTSIAGPSATPSASPAANPRNANTARTLPITVEGEQFGWNIRYPGPDQELGTDDDVVTRRHLQIPARTKIRLTVGSQDYLYQLALPQQSVREVAIPGQWQRCAFVVDEPGVYPLVGDQFCGYTHPDLIGKLIVKEPEEFQAWLSRQASE